MKDLSVTIDPELSFNFHCKDMIKKHIPYIRTDQDELCLPYGRCICLSV